MKDAIPDPPMTDNPCLGEDDGTTCGAGQICLRQRCRPDRCGDGFRHGDEECDDGNEVDVGDGCSNSCTIVMCGNGKVEDPETCDDGNRSDGDACPSDCKATVCGDGVVEPRGGEVCEGGWHVARIGEGESYSCSADCKTKQPFPCEECQNAHCKLYPEEEDGLNLVDGCLNRVDPQLVEDANDPDFIQQCINLVNCALAKRCGFGEDSDLASECYCGSRSLDECPTQGPAPDAPCAAEVLAAGRTKSSVEIFTRFVDHKFPVAWASELIDCYKRKCPDSCVPPR